MQKFSLELEAPIKGIYLNTETIDLLSIIQCKTMDDLKALVTNCPQLNISEEDLINWNERSIEDVKRDLVEQYKKTLVPMEQSVKSFESVIRSILRHSGIDDKEIESYISVFKNEGHEGINFLKQGASSGSTNQDDYENLRGYRGKLYYNENPVVDSGSNSNGTWVKWMDGTMICYKHINFGDVVITTAWGSFYETASDYSCGNYPQAFVETPCISIMPINTCFDENRANTTATSWGSFWACRPAQYDSFSLVVDCIAIGRWK